MTKLCEYSHGRPIGLSFVKIGSFFPLYHGPDEQKVINLCYK